MNFMEQALKLAKCAASVGEVPVGAVIVKDGKIIAEAYNTKEKDKNVTAHAEINAISKACKVLNSWRLDGCDMYVTAEPCMMCAGAILQSRIKRLYFGCFERETGAFGSRFDAISVYGGKCEVYGGICEDLCAEIMKNFFDTLR